MMAKALGLTFGDECIAAGLGGLPFSWGATTDDMVTDQLTADQLATLDTVIAAHDPTKPPIPAQVTNRQFYQQLTLDGIISQSDCKKAMRGTLPTEITNYIASLPAAEQFDAEMRYLAMTMPRDDGYVTGGLQALGVADLDAFFTAAALL